MCVHIYTAMTLCSLCRYSWKWQKTREWMQNFQVSAEHVSIPKRVTFPRWIWLRSCSKTFFLLCIDVQQSRVFCPSQLRWEGFTMQTGFFGSDSRSCCNMLKSAVPEYVFTCWQFGMQAQHSMTLHLPSHSASYFSTGVCCHVNAQPHFSFWRSHIFYLFISFIFHCSVWVRR